MFCITVTFLVRTIEKPNDCSVVRDSNAGPKLHHGCNLRGNGRRHCNAGVGCIPPRRMAAVSKTPSPMSRYKGPVEGGTSACEAFLRPKPAPPPPLRPGTSPCRRGFWGLHHSPDCPGVTALAYPHCSKKNGDNRPILGQLQPNNKYVIRKRRKIRAWD